MSINERQPVLVFGDDGSQGADVAWLWINNQAWSGWVIDVVSADRPDVGPPPPQASVDVHEWQPDVPRRFLGEGAEVAFLQAKADPREVLGRFDGADLIVVGPRGRGLLKSLGLGSTTEWLLQCPPAPLVIVRSAQPVQHALVCVDGSAHAQLAVQTLARLPLAQGIKATVFHVGTYGQPHPPQVAEAVDLLTAAGADVKLHDVTPDPLDAFYSVRDMVFDAQARTSADLLVLGTRGLSGWRSLTSGSIASAVARHSPASVLMAHLPSA